MEVLHNFEWRGNDVISDETREEIIKLIRAGWLLEYIVRFTEFSIDDESVARLELSKSDFPVPAED